MLIVFTTPSYVKPDTTLSSVTPSICVPLTLSTASVKPEEIVKSIFSEVKPTKLISYGVKETDLKKLYFLSSDVSSSLSIIPLFCTKILDRVIEFGKFHVTLSRLTLIPSMLMSAKTQLTKENEKRNKTITKWDFNICNSILFKNVTHNPFCLWDLC